MFLIIFFFNWKTLALLIFYIFCFWLIEVINERGVNFSDPLQCGLFSCRKLRAENIFSFKDGKLPPGNFFFFFTAMMFSILQVQKPGVVQVVGLVNCVFVLKAPLNAL